MFRSLLKRLPSPLLNPLRQTYRLLKSSNASVVDRGKSFSVAANFDPESPLAFVKPETFAAINSHLGNPRVLFQMQFARQVVARDRAEHFFGVGAVSRVQGQNPLIAFNALDYNLDGAKSAPMLDRPIVMTNVVTSIGRVQQNIEELDVLSIGPRSEIEIFGMIAAGFRPERIKGLDLFSYSPLIDVGDMHQTPYQDGSFDIIMLGWVLSYSRDQQAVAREIMRIARDGAIIVLAGDYSDDTRDRPTFKNDTTHMQNCEQLLALFGDRVGRVYFRHDPELPDVPMVMTVFAIRKPKAA